ncbi:MAG: DUF4446 family protein [Candidatus Curtissbacteria bacterium]
MEKLQFIDYLIAAVFIWLTTLSFYFVRVFGSWNRLTKSGKNLNLAQILENIIRDQAILVRRVDSLSASIEGLQKQSKNYFQKQALVRFNPFEDTGGDQSFIVALLNGADNGFIISSLHSRNGTRVYAKLVEAGKPAGHQFSKEEKEIVEKAAGTKDKN